MRDRPLETLEDIFSERDKNWIERDAAFREIIMEEGVYYEGKDIIKCGYLGDLEKIGRKLEIHNLYNPDDIVRKIDITNNEVIIDVMDGSSPVHFPKNTPVFYEPWFMDRGSYLIWVDSIGKFGKLSTEMDIVKKVG